VIALSVPLASGAVVLASAAGGGAASVVALLGPASGSELAGGAELAGPLHAEATNAQRREPHAGRTRIRMIEPQGVTA
jgi:hypothetical protein